MAKTALVIVADGTEEMEAVIIIDILRRANIQVCVAGLNNKCPIECSRLVKLVPDCALSDVTDKVFDAVILPGGLKGAHSFKHCATLGAVLKEQEAAGRICAAICAAPIAFDGHGIGKGKKITCYPGVKDQLKDYIYSEDRVVVDDNLITSRGPGTAVEFALQLVQIIVSHDERHKLAKAMLIKE